MARTSRYQKNTDAFSRITVPGKTGIYTRVSVSDGDDISDSISHQIQLAANYINQSEDLKLVKTYADDGYTGRNFNRPGFGQLMQDVEAGRINCIVVKDVSRLGRNYLTVGKLLLDDFPERNIRFISILDDYDSATNQNNKELKLMLQSIIDQAVSADTSRRVSTAIMAKKEAGTFLPASGSIPYGYLRDEKNCTYAIDNDAFWVVKRIYHLRANGYNISAICRELNDKGIPSPSKLKYLRHQTQDEKARDALWNRATVRKILSDQTYIGHRVHGKKAQASPSEAKRRTSKDTWQIIENVHPAIISKELFESVQAMNGSESGAVKAATTPVSECPQTNILKGKIFCGDCGRAMKAAKGGDGTANFNCSSYKESGGTRCSNHYISQASILTAITQRIEEILADGFLSEGGTSEIAKYENQITKLDAEVHQLSVQQDKLSNTLITVHESYRRQRITKEEFKEQIEHISTNLTHCEITERNLTSEKAKCKEQLRQLTHLLAALRIYQDSRVLTRELVDAFIDKILIFPRQRIEFVLAASQLTEVTP